MKTILLALCLAVSTLTAQVPETREPLYLLTLNFQKVSFSLDIWQHAKDGMQTVELVLPVDKEFFNQQVVGTKLKSQFRGWSLFSNGVISSYEITVKTKTIKARQ